MNVKKKDINLKNTNSVKEYNKALTKGLQIRHVFKGENGWVIKRNGAKKISNILSSQSLAIDKAREMTRRSGASVIVHKSNGKINKIIAS